MFIQSDEEEEMPPEAKLRMRNIGKYVPITTDFVVNHFLMIGTPPLPLDPTHSIRERWDSQILELATRDTVMMTEHHMLLYTIMHRAVL